MEYFLFYCNGNSTANIPSSHVPYIEENDFPLRWLLLLIWPHYTIVGETKSNRFIVDYLLLLEQENNTIYILKENIKNQLIICTGKENYY